MVSTGIYLDKRRPLKDDKYPLKIRVTEERKNRLYSLEVKNKKVVLTENGYNSLFLKKPPKDLLELKASIDEVMVKVNGCIKEIENFTWV